MTHPPSPTNLKSGLDVAVDAARNATGSPEQVAKLREAFQALPPVSPSPPLKTIPNSWLQSLPTTAKLSVLGLACGAALWAIPIHKPARELSAQPSLPQPAVAAIQTSLPPTVASTALDISTKPLPRAMPVRVKPPHPPVRIRTKRSVRREPTREGANQRNDAPLRQTELQLLANAQRNIAQAPKHTLEILRSHADHYPQGVFAQERDRLEIDALGQLGRAGEAKVRARAFLKRYPQSAHSLRLQRYFE